MYLAENFWKRINNVLNFYELKPISYDILNTRNIGEPKNRFMERSLILSRYLLKNVYVDKINYSIIHEAITFVGCLQNDHL